MNKQPIALITGISGMDASYLAELLLSKGWRVVGLMRRSSTDTTSRLAGVKSNPNFGIVEGDITDASGVMSIIASLRPDHIYHLAAMSHVQTSFATPSATMEIDAIGTINILEAVRQTSPQSRLYFAATSELFGDTTESPQNEQTRLNPASPYGIAKLASYHFVRLYREAYGLFAANGILFNHESPRRGLNFVTRKITRYVAQMYLAHQQRQELAEPLRLGNLDARRDWSDARDMVRGMLAILSHHEPLDFVLASGVTRSVREFLDIAFGAIGTTDWESHVVVDDSCRRPQDVNLLLGDASLAKKILGWKPTIKYADMVYDMIENDVHELSGGSVSLRIPRNVA